MFSSDYWKAIFMRAWHAVWETAAATLPASIIITPAMIEHFDCKVFYVVLAWIATALMAGVFSIVKSLAAGVPEVNLQQTLYDQYNDPEDDDDYEEYEDPENIEEGDE